MKTLLSLSLPPSLPLPSSPLITQPEVLRPLLPLPDVSAVSQYHRFGISSDLLLPEQELLPGRIPGACGNMENGEYTPGQ